MRTILPLVLVVLGAPVAALGDGGSDDGTRGTVPKPPFSTSSTPATLPPFGTPSSTPAPASAPPAPPPASGAPPAPPASPSTSAPASAAVAAPQGTRWVGRGGLIVDLSQTLGLAGTPTDGRFLGGLHGGFGYLVTRTVDVGVDLNLLGSVNPLGVGPLELVPGVRVNLPGALQLHLGLPLPFVPELGVGALAGVAYLLPLSNRAALVLGAEYALALTEASRRRAPDGRLDVHLGVQVYR